MLISSISDVNIGNIENNSNIGRYYRINIVSGISKSDTILPIHIGIDRFFETMIKTQLQVWHHI